MFEKEAVTSSGYLFLVFFNYEFHICANSSTKKVFALSINVLLFFRTHMQDLKDVTNNVHYENYRSRKLAAVTCNNGDSSQSRGHLTK